MTIRACASRLLRVLLVGLLVLQIHEPLAYAATPVASPPPDSIANTSITISKYVFQAVSTAISLVTGTSAAIGAAVASYLAGTITFSAMLAAIPVLGWILAGIGVVLAVVSMFFDFSGLPAGAKPDMAANYLMSKAGTKKYGTLAPLLGDSIAIAEANCGGNCGVLSQGAGGYNEAGIGKLLEQLTGQNLYASKNGKSGSVYIPPSGDVQHGVTLAGPTAATALARAGLGAGGAGFTAKQLSNPTVMNLIMKLTGEGTFTGLGKEDTIAACGKQQSNDDMVTRVTSALAALGIVPAGGPPSFTVPAGCTLNLTLFKDNANIGAQEGMITLVHLQLKSDEKKLAKDKKTYGGKSSQVATDNANIAADNKAIADGKATLKQEEAQLKADTLAAKDGAPSVAQSGTTPPSNASRNAAPTTNGQSSGIASVVSASVVGAASNPAVPVIHPALPADPVLPFYASNGAGSNNPAPGGSAGANSAGGGPATGNTAPGGATVDPSANSSVCQSLFASLSSAQSSLQTASAGNHGAQTGAAVAANMNQVAQAQAAMTAQGCP